MSKNKDSPKKTVYYGIKDYLKKTYHVPIVRELIYAGIGFISLFIFA